MSRRIRTVHASRIFGRTRLARPTPSRANSGWPIGRSAKPGRRRLELERLEPRGMLSGTGAATAGVSVPVTITGTAGDDAITIARAVDFPAAITYTVNGVRFGPVVPQSAIRVFGLAGNDTITVAADVYAPTILDGGAGRDRIVGGSGNDVILARDGESDVLDGGLGDDAATYDSTDSAPTNCERWQPFTAAADNQTKHLKVLVVNFDPLVPSQGNRKLWEIFNWGNPYEKASEYEATIEAASGGAVAIDIVGWRNVNEIPAFYDGSRYTPDQYYENRRTNKGWNLTSSVDVPRIFTEQNLAPLVDNDEVDEIWFFADHYFLVGGEAFMAGPGSFFINGPTFEQIPLKRAVACMGFSYERGVDMMLHNTGHRTESTLNRVYGGWNLASPSSNWDRFSANAWQSNGVAGVGTTHFPANATSDYDTANTRVVQSWADDFLDYPNLTGRKTAISRDSWGKGVDPDFERSYQAWYFLHLPRAPGMNADGRQNNWWKYLYDFDNYTASGAPKPASAVAAMSDLYNLGDTTYRFTVTYRSPVPIRRSSLDAQDIVVKGPRGFQGAARLVSASDARDDTCIVATYEFDAPGGSWDAADRGLYTAHLQPAQVVDGLGGALAARVLGSMSARSGAAVPLAADAATLLLARFDGTANTVDGEVPTQSTGVSFTPGKLGQAGVLGVGDRLLFPQAGNISAAAGTVELWIRPDWEADGKDRQFFQAGQDFNNGMILSIDGANNLRFIQWGDDPETPAVETHVERGLGRSGADWTAGRWHHVAATWDSAKGVMEFFVDGVSAGTSQTVTIPAFTDTSLAIGSRRDGARSADAAFDELRVSSRALTAGEIEADYHAGRALRNLNLASNPATLQAGSSTRFKATAEDEDGVEYDVSRLVKWSSSVAARATVDSAGNVSALGAGGLIVSATLDSLSAEKPVTIAVTGGPTAALVDGGASVSTFAQRWIDIAVRYSDADGIDVSTLGLGDVRVRGPNGFSGFATLVGVESATTGFARVATYRVAAPHGYWNATDNGTYAVEVGDHVLVDTKGTPNVGLGVIGTFRVNVTDVASSPGTPSGLVGSAGNGRASLSWTAPVSNGGATISDYRVQYSTNNGATWTTFADAVSPATTATVTGLANGVSYVFRVAAVNAAGVGAFTVKSSAVTPRTIPGAPTGVAVVAGNGRVVISWRAPDFNGGAAIGDYQVQYSSNNGTTWTTFADATSSATSATVTGLINGVSYVFRVAALNAAGIGGFTAKSAGVAPRTIPGVPTGLTVVAGTRSAAVRWTAPAANGGAVISDYRVQFSSNGGTTWTTFAEAVSSATSATVTGLTRGVSYVFRVAAVNAAGRGDYTARSPAIQAR